MTNELKQEWFVDYQRPGDQRKGMDQYLWWAHQNAVDYPLLEGVELDLIASNISMKCLRISNNVVHTNPTFDYVRIHPHVLDVDLSK